VSPAKIAVPKKKDPLSALGMDVDEVIAIDSTLRTRPAERDGRVCLCGHSLTKHTEVGGIVMCKPSKMDCPCKKARAVIDAEDTRPFLRKTQGAGPMHALSRGLAALIQSGKEAEWIIDLVCDKCKKSNDNLSPVPVTKDGRSSEMATGYDALLCPKCRETL
jgi:hypothetical protein